MVLVVGRRQELEPLEHHGDDDHYLYHGKVVADVELRSLAKQNEHLQCEHATETSHTNLRVGSYTLWSMSNELDYNGDVCK